MEVEALQKWFEGIWEVREEKFFRQWFGTLGESVYTLPKKVFEGMGMEEVDPRFLFHGVFECPPVGGRNDWVYVSSGMSNAWGETPETADAAGVSGLGFEFVLHTRERQRWAIELMHWLMAVQLGVACGRLQGDFIQRNDRVGIGRGIPLKSGPGLITHLLATSGEEAIAAGGGVSGVTYPAEFSLETGRVEMLLLIGITEREREFAQVQGVEGLVTLLRHQGIFPLTRPERASAV